MSFLPAYVVLKVHCAHCHGAVQLECEGLHGYLGYETYNEYFCPHCRKQNHQLSAGGVVSARARADDTLTGPRA
jgi:hypothetical protein